jgi:hypothetical protein
VKYAPLLDQQFRARKRPVGSSWRLDETYLLVAGFSFSGERKSARGYGFEEMQC